MFIISDKKASEDKVMRFRKALKSLQVYYSNLSYLDVGFSWDISPQLDFSKNSFFWLNSCRWWKHEEEQKKP